MYILVFRIRMWLIVLICYVQTMLLKKIVKTTIKQPVCAKITGKSRTKKPGIITAGIFLKPGFNLAGSQAGFPKGPGGPGYQP